ncbi:MAG: NUDIX hydrolase [Chitinophagaceae bacterium]|nr:NUDIX hydrolase [Chitinophagaceae bacterium]MBK9568585.1 NUDIX hydrolase [Chitinophagaceae bacterium]MBL0130984.1 NUDIX hydrolase [Chitinophagaceae bacterium]MBL0272710.1 NUDIX hydrolase [Chitinophagaceae bacterium]
MTERELRLKTAEIEKISHIDYFNIAISVDCVIFGYDDKELKVLLIKSDLEEFAGLFSLLGDLIRPDEDLETASYRILKERTGLDDVYLEQVQAFGSIKRHPSGRVITIAYYSLIDIKHHKMQLSHNELNWHPVNELKKLAFDHKLILDTCLLRLQQRVLETPIVFNLLPEKFSLRELQELYEAILGIGLDRRNFRKKISIKDWLIDIGEIENDVPHRPGKLYKLKPELKIKPARRKLQPGKS